MSSWNVSSAERLDAFVTREGGFVSRAQAQRVIEEGLVAVNGKTVLKLSYPLKPADQVNMKRLPKREDTGAIAPKDLKLKILYEDDACFVIDKPDGLAVHPGAGMESDATTLLHGIAYLFKKQKLPFSLDAVLVHRLDQETTGCLLVAKTQAAHAALQKQFEARTVQKFYLAITAGVPSPAKATIDAPIGRSTSNRTKMSISRVSAPRDAKTSYVVLSEGMHAALLLCELHTGRTHQIRVHLQAIGHPLLGDEKYANQTSERLTEEYEIPTVCLHAWKLTFRSPADHNTHEVIAPIPDLLKSVMDALRLKTP